MSYIGGSTLKDILSIKIKYRHDGFTDQFSRIFMAKMFIVSAFVMSIDFFSDTISCFLLESASTQRDFAHSACWIQGFYIYEDLKDKKVLSSYYGVPGNMATDGITLDGKKLCNQVNKETNLLNKNCRAMKKVYFVQYQYFPFYIASLALLYYLPYLLFRVLNSDMISLRTDLNGDECTKSVAIKIADNYFNYENNGGVLMLRLRSLGNFGMKVIYVAVNIGGFLFTDNLLNHNYINYGIEWIKWSQLNGTSENKGSKPGNILLPSMGLCDINAGSKDRIYKMENKYTSVCEISSHILYQYVLLVLWFLFMCGILLSTVGLVLHIGGIFTTSANCIRPRQQRKCPYYLACKQLTLREIEYMKVLKMKNISLYNSILHSLQPKTGV